MTWSELFPEGRHIFYEGDDPKAFAKEMQEKFGFDPSKDNDDWTEERGYCFLCSADCLDEVYGNDRYRLGS